VTSGKVVLPEYTEDLCLLGQEIKGKSNEEIVWKKECGSGQV
jgi:hypothetical protein